MLALPIEPLSDCGPKHNGKPMEPGEGVIVPFHDFPIGGEEAEESNAYREAARRQAFIMNRAFIFITTAENTKLAAWQVALAIGLQCCEGRDYTDIGNLCGVGKASVGKGATHFCDVAGLPPSLSMKNASARKSYKQSRIKSISDNNPEIESGAA